AGPVVPAPPPAALALPAPGPAPEMSAAPIPAPNPPPQGAVLHPPAAPDPPAVAAGAALGRAAADRADVLRLPLPGQPDGPVRPPGGPGAVRAELLRVLDDARDPGRQPGAGAGRLRAARGAVLPHPDPRDHPLPGGPRLPGPAQFKVNKDKCKMRVTRPRLRLTL